MNRSVSNTEPSLLGKAGAKYLQKLFQWNPSVPRYLFHLTSSTCHSLPPMVINELWSDLEECLVLRAVPTQVWCVCMFQFMRWSSKICQRPVQRGQSQPSSAISTQTQPSVTQVSPLLIHLKPGFIIYFNSIFPPVLKINLNLFS